MSPRLISAIVALEQINSGIGLQRDLSTVDSRRAILDMRKRTNAGMTELEAAAQELFVARPADLSKFRSRLAAVRHTLTLHQASWPAVSLNERTQDYLASAENVRDTVNEFLRWLRVSGGA